MVEELADQPRNSAEFTFSDEQVQLRTAVRKFCTENFDEETVRRLMESDPPFDAAVWKRLGSELARAREAVGSREDGLDEAEVLLGAPSAGKSISGLGLPRGTAVGGIVRKGGVIHADDDMRLEVGDRLVILAPTKDEAEVRKALSG